MSMSMLSRMLLADGSSFWMPPQASSYAANIDFVFYFILWVCAIFFVIIAGALFYFMIAYRRRSHNDPVSRVTHNTPLEIAWSVLPSFLLVLMFWWGYVEYKNFRTVPANPYEVNLRAYQWNFEFTYPNGHSDNELHIELNRPVRLVMKSDDVLHACFIPAFRAKRDVVPGRYAELWFTPTKVGVYPMLCAEYCGTSHSDMNAKVVVHPPGEQAIWLRDADPLKKLTDEMFEEYKADPQKMRDKYSAIPEWKPVLEKLKPTPVELGQELRTKKGCVSCHSIDGSPGTGPSFKGIWGKPVDFADGTTFTPGSEADWHNYFIESVTDPGKKLVKGYGNNMSKIPVSPREIEMLAAYLKSLKE